MTLILDPIVDDPGHYFTIAEFRASEPEFADAVAYTDLAIGRARIWAEERFEMAAHCAWVERTSTEAHIGAGTMLRTDQMDVRAIISATIGGVPIDVSALVVLPYGYIRREALWDAGAVVEITYTYGKSVIPAPVKEAVMLLTGFKLVPNNLRSNATSESTDVGFIRLAHATPGGKTGLLEVDAVASDYGHAPMRRSW